MSACGPSRQAAFFKPTVANGALRTLLDLQLAPPSRHDRSTVMWRAKKRENLSSARHYDQIGFRFYTTKTHLRHRSRDFVVMHPQ